MAKIIVTLPGRGQIAFEEGTSDSVINETILREFPKDGSDVARIIAEDPTQAKSISNEDFELYEGFLDKKKTDFVGTAANAAGYLASTVGAGIKGLFEARNLNPEVAAATAIESGAQGTRDLYGMLAQSEDPSSIFFKFKDFINGTGTVEDRKKQWLEARDFSENTRKMEAGQQTVSGIDPSLINNDVKNALKLIADPTLFIPGVGELLGAGKLGARVTGAAMEAAGRTAQAVTRPLVDIVDASTRMAGEAFGANANAVKGLAAGSGVTGVVMGVPGVREAAIAYGTVEGVNKAGQVLETAGQALGRTPTRIGALESLALNPNASAVDRALAKVGRYGGDDLIDIGARSAAGAVEGAAIGTTLGYLSAGEEGAAGGFGTGGLLGGAGAGAARLYGKASGAAAIENRHGDYKRFYETLDPETQAKFDTIVKQSGLDGASQVMDVSGLVRGKFNDADVRFSTTEEFAKKYGQDARGVQVNEGDRPVIDINVDKFSSQLTAGHELFHAFKAIDQLRPMAEKVEQMIVGNYVIDQNGKSVRTATGLLDDAAVVNRFNEYVAKLQPDASSPWSKANTLLEKSKLVGEELGAEYMTRMIAGSDTDVMLRGFDGLTRTILDHALLSNTDGFIRRTAQSIGLGSKPIESLVFSKLENASPALNAALRDMVRARRNMSEKIALADDNGYSISRKDLANPAAAKVATDMGIAEVSPDGIVRMKPDDVLAKEDRESADALANAIKSAPVIDASEPRLREVDGQVIGDGISNAQLAAIQASPSIIDKVKQAISIVKDSIDNGNVILIRNGKATKEIRSKLTGKTLKRYNDGVRITERDVVPYSLATSKSGELYIRTFDISKARGEAMKLAGRDRLGPYGADFQTFYGDLTRYLNNLSDRENAVPTKELLGDASKAAYMTDFFGGKDGTSAKYIRNFTLDRMVDMRLTGEKVNMSQIAYDRNKVRFMPAETIGDGKVFNSPDSGFKIISKDAGKHSLYAPTGERVGIYDTQAKAEAKANSESKSIKNAPHGIYPVDPAQAKSILDGSTQHLNDGNLLATVNFMPDSPEVKRLMREFPLDEEAKKKMQGKTGFAFVSDWADSNRKYVTDSGREVDVMKGGMGYTYLPEVIGKGAWAGTFSALTNRVVKKINASDGIGLVVLGGEKSSASSRSFSLAFAAEIQDAIASKQLKRKDIDSLIKQAFYQINRPEIKTLEDYIALIPKERNAENPGGLTFEQRDRAVRRIGSAKNSRALGVPNWNDVLRKYMVQKGDYQPGQIVSVVQFEKGKPAVRSQVAGTANHPSYEAVLLGKPIGVLTQKVMIADFFKDFFAFAGTKPASFTRKVQTKMPMFKYGEGSSVLEGRPMTEVNFMPSEQAIPESKFYSSRIISAVENSSQGKANGSQWKATIKNSKLGVNQDEYALTRVEDLEAGKTYTKAEVLDYLRANEVVVKDVTLGGVPDGVEAKRKEIEAKIDDSTLVTDAMKAGYNQLDAVNLPWRIREGRTNISSLPDSILDEAKRVDALWKEWDGLDKSVSNQTTHFSEYTLPGAKEGSYREVLLTVPATPKISRSREMTLGDIPAGATTQEFLALRGRALAGEKLKYTEEGETWRDGHSQYDNIPNPIVRLRTNERTTADGKRMLFIEEVQAPQKGQFEKMPALFQKNWRDIAFKWSLRTAADNGFDSVGWTTGEQQAARYDLSKQIDKLYWYPSEDGKGTLIASSKEQGDIINKQIAANEIGDYVGKEIAKRLLDAKPTAASQARAEQMTKGGAKDVPHRLSGVDLKIGGEGLKKLYDQDFRNVVNNLPVVKKSGQKVGMADILTDKKGWHLTPPNRTTHGGWMVKSGDYNSQGTRFSPTTEGEAKARAFLAERLNDSKVEVYSINVAPEMRNASVSFMPSIKFSAAENLPNGKVWRGENGYAIMQKEGGKFRVHSPIGLIGIAASYEAAEKMASKRNNK